MSGSTELVEVKGFVIIGSRWRVEVGTDSVVNKVSWLLDHGGGHILYLKIILSLTFDFGAVD